ncbi:MAG: hypothetical protein WAX57_00510 [Minisyncoccia bacterium]
MLRTFFARVVYPHRQMLALSVFYSALTILSLFPLLFGGKIFNTGDATIYYYPAFDFYSTALKSGASFLWNPWLFSGFPMYLSQSAGFLDPLNIALFKALYFLDAYHVRLGIDMVLVFIFSFLAMRKFGLSTLAASLVGPAYLSAFHWVYISNLVIANSLFITPFLFWIAAHTAELRTRRMRWFILAGAGIGWSLLSGYAQPTIYAAILFGIFIVFDHLLIQRSNRAVLVQTAGLLVCAAIVGVIVALPQLLPALDFTVLTVRANGLAYELTTAKVINYGDSILFLFPDYLYFPYISGGRRPLYIGPLMFFLAVFGLIYLGRALYRRTPVLEKREKRLLLLGGLFAACILIALPNSPLFYLINKLPVLSYFRYPYRWMYVGIWFLACLGAYGFDHLRSRPLEPWTKWFAACIALGVAALTTMVVAFNTFSAAFWTFAGDGVHRILELSLYGHGGLTKDPVHYRDAISRGIGAWQDALSLQNLSFAIPFAFLVLSAVLIALRARNTISLERFSLIGAGLIIGVLPSTFILQWRDLIPREMMSSYQMTVQQIPNLDPRMYRVFPFMLGAGFQKYIPPQYTLDTEELKANAELQFGAGWPNVHQYASVRSVDGYDPFVPRQYLSALESLGSTHAGSDASRGRTELQMQEQLLGHLDLLGMMSGRYIFSGVPLRHPDLMPVSEYPVTRYAMPIYIYENTRALPRIYFASEIVQASSETDELLFASTSDFRTNTYLACTDCSSGAPDSADGFTVEEDENGLLSISTQTKSARWLIVNDSFLPGWSATIDGEGARIVRANGLYMAVEIPPGQHAVAFRYNGVRDELRTLQFLGIVHD